ncbi:septation protein SepH [Agromyces sp. MMS24-JH15]|uniref:septation protein SepH n=1 Tax=Agromyces sp. MMS24-JH15 TaxID=3243765 RepID=UPI003749FF74
MQELKVIGVENGALLAASDDGARFRIEIDEVLQSRIRQVQPEVHQGPRLSPREIQAQIRAGLSAEEIAQLTGASVDYVRRFEGPVIAEREHIVASALSVTVHLPDDLDPAVDEPASFGTVIRDRLARLGALGERWASWKDEERGWIVKLEFTADEIDHDARWGFDPKRQTLQPLNPEAITLSHQREPDGGMIPRLRAVGPDHEASRFDSGAFSFEPEEAVIEDVPQPEPLPYGRPAPLAPAASSPAVARAAIKRAEEPPPAIGETADLLEALRRRRGEREAAVESSATPPATAPAAPTSTQANAATPDDAGSQPVAEAPTAAVDPSARPVAPEEQPGAAARALWGGRGANGKPTRRGRASMPSWDEIVFGARPDDDLA